MERYKFPGLSYFEAVLHGNHKKITLFSEILDCFNYFEQHVPGKHENEHLSLIHGNKIEIKRVDEGKGFAVNINGEVKIVGIDQISRVDQIDMVRKIRTITIPYANYIRIKHHSSS